MLCNHSIRGKNGTILLNKIIMKNKYLVANIDELFN
ncbi:unnamed protein product [Spirodela intermedia]|uniref:Uncharacterized protein n=1 Tax=Spirodela intermedia TaxID=51605 RepID=A0A7I8K7A1_SPIIN|nr:unnamed protein product [Spirodela intermedia]